MDAVVAEAAKLGYPVNEMAIGGGSAGGCLALLYAYRDTAESPVPVRFVFEAVGPSSFYLAVVPDFRATGVREGKRAYDWPCIIRCINTVDVMTAEVPELDWALLKRMTARVNAEVPDICRVCYDLTPMPFGTVEWE